MKIHSIAAVAAALGVARLPPTASAQATSSCSQDSDCDGEGGACGRAESLETAPYVCCPNGEKDLFVLAARGAVCTDLPAGAACHDGENELCASGACGMDNLCLEQKLGGGSPCREYDHDMCASGACAQEVALEDAPFVCCPSGEMGKITLFFWVCTGLDLGAPCKGTGSVCASGVCGLDDVCIEDKIEDGDPCRKDDHDMCASNACGRSEALYGSELVCCSSGEYEYLGTRLGNVCTNLPAGAACSLRNSLCASEVCGPDQVCLEGKSENGSPCRTISNCLSGACAREEALTDSPSVCCPSGDSEYLYSEKMTVCTGLPPGSACGSANSVCASGACGMDNLCSEEKIAGGSPCRKGEDDMCSTGACAREGASVDAGYICCPSDDTMYHGYSIGRVCAGILPVGAVCDKEGAGFYQYNINALCESGLCGEDNICTEENAGSDGEETMEKVATTPSTGSASQSTDETAGPPPVNGAADAPADLPESTATPTALPTEDDSETAAPPSATGNMGSVSKSAACIVSHAAFCFIGAATVLVMGMTMFVLE